MPTTAELAPRAKPYLDPIPGAAPTGKDARQEPAYEEVTREIEKLSALTGAKVAWPTVVEKGSEILKGLSKDLRIATFVAFGLYNAEGLDGLATGAITVAEMMEAYWPTMFPDAARIKGRVGALKWLLDKMAETLPGRQVSAKDRAALESLQVAMKRLSEVARAKFGGDCPGFGPTMEAVERLKASVPDAPKAAPPPPASSSSEAPAQAAPAAPAPAAAAAPAPAADPAKALEFLRQVGTSLIDTSAVLRKANAGDPVSYRILRVGCWLHMVKAPDAPGGKTQIPALAPDVRARLEKLASESSWAELLDQAESTLPKARFLLDLHRYTALALHAMGHTPARQALMAEVATLLRRMPEVADLKAVDGSPLCAPETRAWISQEVLPKSGGGAGQALPVAASAAADGKADEWVAEARKLLSTGKAADALALGSKRAASASGGRARFQARLELAGLCASSGQKALARTLYEALDQECVSRQMDDWDPALSAACLEGLLTLTRGKDMTPADLASRARRLAVLDPVAALRAIS